MSHHLPIHDDRLNELIEEWRGRLLGRDTPALIKNVALEVVLALVELKQARLFFQSDPLEVADILSNPL